MTDWSAHFPRLFAPRFETYANAHLEFRLGVPPDEDVVRLHVVALDPPGRRGGVPLGGGVALPAGRPT